MRECVYHTLIKTAFKIDRVLRMLWMAKRFPEQPRNDNDKNKTKNTQKQIQRTVRLGC